MPSRILFVRRFPANHYDLRQRLSRLGVKDSTRGFICFLPGAEPDVNVSNLGALFDLDDLRLILIRRVGVEGSGVIAFRATVRLLTTRAENVTPRRQAVDAIDAAIIRPHHPPIVVTDSSLRLAGFIHKQQLKASLNERSAFGVNHAPRYYTAANKRDVNVVARFTLVERHRSEDFRVRRVFRPHIGFRKRADHVSAFGQSRYAVTPGAVSPNFDD